jgi:two-component system, NtrC family, sensor histidine kinase PilS
VDRISAKDTNILERIVVKICIFRIAFLGILLLPLGLVPLWEELPQNIFIHLSPYHYAALITAGFFVTIVYLLSWPGIRNIVRFLRLQMATDFILSLLLVFISGGIKSGFVFAMLGLTYLYGSTLGYRTGSIFGLASSLVLLIFATVQYLFPGLWGNPSYAVDDLLFIFSLQLLALGLILYLLRVGSGQGQEEKLIQDLHFKERALRQAQILKSMVFDWMESGLLVLNENGTISAINRQAAVWAGAGDPSLAVGRPLKDFFPALARLWEKHRSTPSDRLEAYERNGEVLFGLRITPLSDQGGLIIFSDITPVRKLETRVRSMEKLAAVGELAAGLAHEIKNPLAGIKASLQLITKGDLDEGTALRLNRVILRDIDRLDGLLKDFLTFARPSTASPQPLSLDGVIRECLSFLLAQYPKVEISISPALEERSWSWDKHQFMQVVINLLLNAFQAVQHQDNGIVEIDHFAVQGEECLIIRDNGAGVDPESVSRIFDPFFTTKETGTGLGLSIAQRLAGQNKSWIELAGAKGGGTEARIHFLAHQETQAARNKGPELQEATSLEAGQIVP